MGWDVAENLPYVVTDDIELVMAKFPQSGISIPDRRVLTEVSFQIQVALNDIFPSLEVLPASRIARFLNQQIEASKVPVISLTGLMDRSAAAGYLRFSRSVAFNEMGGGFLSVGLCPRAIKDGSYAAQFNEVAGIIGQREVALVDDVVFSGDTVCSVIDELNCRGVRVQTVIASVAMAAAAEILRLRNIDMIADKTYDTVIDEVCMRDFIVGVPDGGRNIIGVDGEYSAVPYIKPFGDVCGWASIAGRAADSFSRAAIQASLTLWRAIEERNDRPILVGDLPKPIYSWTACDRIVDRLTACLG